MLFVSVMQSAVGLLMRLIRCQGNPLQYFFLHFILLSYYCYINLYLAANAFRPPRPQM